MQRRQTSKNWIPEVTVVCLFFIEENSCVCVKSASRFDNARKKHIGHTGHTGHTQLQLEDQYGGASLKDQRGKRTHSIKEFRTPGRSCYINNCARNQEAKSGEPLGMCTITAIFISIRKREFRRAVLRKAEPLCGALPSHGNHLNVYVMSHFSIILCEGQNFDLR